jgi:hypothetical protein
MGPTISTPNGWPMNPPKNTTLSTMPEMVPGDWAVMTQDWTYTSPVYHDTHSGKKGDRFKIGLFIPAQLSDSGFAFYRGDAVDGNPREIICPAEYCQKMEGGNA